MLFSGLHSLFRPGYNGILTYFLAIMMFLYFVLFGDILQSETIIRAEKFITLLKLPEWIRK